jgi:hypothetical protein
MLLLQSPLAISCGSLVGVLSKIKNQGASRLSAISRLFRSAQADNANDSPAPTGIQRAHLLARTSTITIAVSPYNANGPGMDWELLEALAP